MAIYARIDFSFYTISSLRYASLIAGQLLNVVLYTA
jgi:hypothetical protein